MQRLWILLTLTLLFTANAVAQPAALAELKASAASNKDALAKYTWQEEQTLSVGGEVKRVTVSSVVLDANGKPVKTQMTETDAPQKQTRGPLRKHVKERKVVEFKDSMKKLAGLVQAYSHPDPEKLEAASKSGNLTVDSSGGPTQMRLTFKSYLKPNDAFVIVFDSTNKALKSVQINSYLDSPDEVVEIDCAFARLQDGTNHVAQSTVVDKKSDITIVTKNSEYRKR